MTHRGITPRHIVIVAVAGTAVILLTVVALWWRPFGTVRQAGIDPVPPKVQVPPPVAPAASPPAEALHVAPGGSALPDGSRERPFATVTDAVAHARPGGTVVLAGGEYHEAIHITGPESLTIRAAPGATVWLDGSAPSTGSAPLGDGRYVLPGQAPRLDRSPTYRRGAPDNSRPGWQFVSGANPLASDPAQVWLDGTALRQVHPASSVTSGTFAVDGDDVVMGDDPEGREVRIGSLNRALVVNAAGTRIEGIGIRRYVPSVPDFGAVVLDAPRVLMSGVVVDESSTTGVSVQNEDTSLENVAVTRSGMLGLHGHQAHGLTVIGSRFDANNRLGFNTSPVAGGVKITEAARVTFRDTDVVANLGSGLWLDEAVGDATITGVRAQGNSVHGVLIELCAQVRVIDSRLEGNDGSGLRIQNSSEINVWNITSPGNRRAVDFVQDGRTAGSPQAPRVPDDPRLPAMTWRIGDSQVINSVLGPSTGDADVAVEDFTQRIDADDVGIRLSGNAYVRGRSGGPQWTHVWSRPGDDPAVYTSVDAFVAQHAQDVGSVQSVEGATAEPQVQPVPPDIQRLSGLTERPPAGATG